VPASTNPAPNEVEKWKILSNSPIIRLQPILIQKNKIVIGLLVV
jgi:hypothetical protein